MGSCHKCGRGKIKRRNGVRKCRRCGFLPESTVDGKKAQNPFGNCFDAAAHNLLGNINDDIKNMTMCHGVGISNYPGIEGKRISHAWIEFDHPQGRCAVDPIFLIAKSSEIYRKDFKAELVVEYTAQEFMSLWARENFPGPWDERVIEFTNKEEA